MSRSLLLFILTLSTLIILPAQLQRSFRMEKGKIISSLDGSATVQQVQLPFSGEVTAFSWDREAPERLLAAGDGFLWRSGNGGTIWQAVVPGLTVRQVAVSQKNPAKILCAGTVTGYNGTLTKVMVSMNGGMTWLNAATLTDRVEDVLLEPDDPVRPIQSPSSNRLLQQGGH